MGFFNYLKKLMSGAGHAPISFTKKEKLEDFFSIDLQHIMDMPLDLDYKEINSSGALIKVYKFFPVNELGIFTAGQVRYFPESKLAKLFLKGDYRGKHAALDEFINFVVHQYGLDYLGRGRISEQEYRDLANRDVWIGRHWFSGTVPLYMGLDYDDENNELELSFHSLSGDMISSEKTSSTYSIVGINFQHLTAEDIGDFEGGYLENESNNPFDEYAVAVYSPRNVRLGYIAKEHRIGIRKKVIDNGGRIIIRGKIEQFINEDSEQRFAGEIWLEDEELHLDEP